MSENMSNDFGDWKEERDKLMRNLEKFKQKALEMMSDKAWKEEHKVMPKLENFKQNASDDYETPLKRLEKEVEKLKKDKAAKDAIIKDLQERISKLEAIPNLAN